MTTTSLLLILAVLVPALLVFLFAAAFARRTRRFWTRAAQGPSGIDQSASLPPLVLDFARRAGAGVGAGHLALILTQKAELRLKRGGLFSEFRARQVIALGQPGFLWQARRGIGPLTWLRIVDAFVDAEGWLEARLFGAMTVAHAEGVETTLGEAYRYLAELPWAPDAILGNPALHWRMVDDQVAEVKIDTRVGTARVQFRFDAAGDITGMAARDRPARDPSGKPVRYDWRGQFGDYRQIGARRLPGYGEVGYVYPEGYEVYFRGRILDCQPG